MWNIGDLCVYYVPEETSSILACVKNVDNVRKRLLLHPFSENDPETWISMSSVFRLTDLYRVNFGMNEPNSSATLQELNKDFFLTKTQRALSLADDKTVLEEFSKALHGGPLISWCIGDICVSKWSEDGEYYYAEVVHISPDTKRCRLSFLFYENEEDKSWLDLYEYSDSKAQLVMDEDNIRVACDRLPRSDKDGHLYLELQTLTTKLPEEKSTSALSRTTSRSPPPLPDSESKITVQHASKSCERFAEPSTTKSGDDRKGIVHTPISPPSFNLDLPLNWKDLLLADEAPHQALLTSWFMCGYHTGYYEGLKVRDKAGQSG